VLPIFLTAKGGGKKGRVVQNLFQSRKSSEGKRESPAWRVRQKKGRDLSGKAGAAHYENLNWRVERKRGGGRGGVFNVGCRRNGIFFWTGLADIIREEKEKKKKGGKRMEKR